MAEEIIEEIPTGEIPPGVPGEPGGSAPPQEPENKSGVQDRINQLTREKREAQEENARLRGQMEGFQMARQATPEPAPEPKVSKPGPLPEQFETDAEYQTALTAHIKKEILDDVRQENQGKTDQDIYNARHAQIMQASKDLPDLLDMTNDPTLRMTGAMLDAADGEDFAKIFHYLGKNRAEYHKIVSLRDPVKEAKAIGAISARLAAPPPKPKKTTKAPDPSPGITPGVGSPEGKKTADSKRAENFAKWEAERRKRAGVQ